MTFVRFQQLARMFLPATFLWASILWASIWLPRAAFAVPSNLKITGTVLNRSTGRPSRGDEVILYRVDRSMHEEERAKSDARGAFQFTSPGGEHARYLLAVSHQKVAYHTPILSGTDPVAISVYDTAPALSGIEEDSHTLFFAMQNSPAKTLTVTEFFVVSNRSTPPRTLAANHGFEFALPRAAVLDAVAVQPPGTLPSRLQASSRGHARYVIAYPLRPGVTKIRATYHLPYSGKASITPVPLHAVTTIALMIPSSLRLLLNPASAFAYRGEQNGLTQYTASNVRPGAALGFVLSGTGNDANFENSERAALASLHDTLRELQTPSGAGAAPLAQGVPLAPTSRLPWQTAHRLTMRWLTTRPGWLACIALALFAGLTWAAARAFRKPRIISTSATEGARCE